MFLHKSDSDVICTGGKLRAMINDYADEFCKSVLISETFSVLIIQINDIPQMLKKQSCELTQNKSVSDILIKLLYNIQGKPLTYV